MTQETDSDAALECHIAQPGERIVRHHFGNEAAIGAALIMVIIALAVTLTSHLESFSTPSWTHSSGQAIADARRQHNLNAIIDMTQERRQENIIETHVAGVAKARTMGEWVAISARNILYRFAANLQPKGSDAYRLATAMRNRLEHKVLYPRAERAYAAVQTERASELRAFIDIFRGDAHALKEGYLHSAKAMLEATLRGQSAIAASKHVVDEAFQSLDPSDSIRLSQFIRRYGSNHYAHSRGYVEQAAAWHEETIVAMDEQEERMRKRQNSVPWIWD